MGEPKEMNISPALTADSILKTADLSNVLRVDVPEWGGHVFVKVMSGAERDTWEVSATNALSNPKNVNIRATLCAITVCDESGKRLFSDTDAAKLGEKSALALDRVFEVARRVNKLTDTDLKELEGN